MEKVTEKEAQYAAKTVVSLSRTRHSKPKPGQTKPNQTGQTKLSRTGKTKSLRSTLLCYRPPCRAAPRQPVPSTTTVELPTLTHSLTTTMF